MTIYRRMTVNFHTHTHTHIWTTDFCKCNGNEQVQTPLLSLWRICNRKRKRLWRHCHCNANINSGCIWTQNRTLAKARACVCVCVCWYGYAWVKGVCKLQLARNFQCKSNNNCVMNWKAHETCFNKREKMQSDKK